MIALLGSLPWRSPSPSSHPSHLIRMLVSISDEIQINGLRRNREKKRSRSWPGGQCDNLNQINRPVAIPDASCGHGQFDYISHIDITYVCARPSCINYLLVGFASGMIAANVLDVLVRWVETLGLFELNALINRLKQISHRNNRTVDAYPFFVFFRSLKRLPCLLIACPAVPPEVVLRDEPIGRIADHVDIRRLSQPVACKIEVEMMFQQKEGLLNNKSLRRQKNVTAVAECATVFVSWTNLTSGFSRSNRSFGIWAGSTLMNLKPFFLANSRSKLFIVELPDLGSLLWKTKPGFGMARLKFKLCQSQLVWSYVKKSDGFSPSSPLCLIAF